MSNLSLSKAVRSNLLSLQSTANMMAKTQTRLATGLKVNTALDNPTNFFTASALNGRAGDLSNLLDSLSSGIKTIESADNGLKSITKTVESMQSTLRQARQDKSFKSQSFAVDAATTGTLKLGGGAVGDTPIELQLGFLSGPSTQSSVSAIGPYYSPMPFAAEVQMDFVDSMQSVGSPGGFTIDVKINGSDFSLVVDGTMMASIGNNDDIIDDELELLGAVSQAAFDSGAFAAGLQVALVGDKLSFSTAGQGSTQSLSIEAASSVAAGYGITAGASDTGQDAGWSFTISNGTQTANIALDNGNANDAAAARATIASQLSAQGVYGITVGGTGDNIDLLGEPDGSNSVTVGGDSRSVQFVFGAGTHNPTTVPGSLGSPTGSSVDELIVLIDSVPSLQGKVRASNDNGKLRIENLSTQDLTIGGIGADGELDGSAGTTVVAGNDVRANLVKQFNDLRDQLDKFADDASFNGINLLRGDKLKLTFNETGTSTIEIQAKDRTGSATSINNTALGIDAALDADFGSDAAIDALLDKLKGALDSLRSQSSTFGSNLSVVENRQEFTRSMINTLETGAANLTLADTNEEAANLLALQTRQQLSSSALSMASQADQAVLRLF